MYQYHHSVMIDRLQHISTVLHSAWAWPAVTMMQVVLMKSWHNFSLPQDTVTCMWHMQETPSLLHLSLVSSCSLQCHSSFNMNQRLCFFTSLLMVVDKQTRRLMASLGINSLNDLRCSENISRGWNFYRSTDAWKMSRHTQAMNSSRSPPPDSYVKWHHAAPNLSGLVSTDSVSTPLSTL